LDHFENLVKHGSRKLSGLGVLLAGMVGRDQSDRSGFGRERFETVPYTIMEVKP